MGTKSEQKRQMILDRARELFAERGFRDVTMKDVAEACGISRGGLYLYYSGTGELFEDVLRMESEAPGESFSRAIAGGASPAEILCLFLNEQQEELLRREDTLALAGYEYAFRTKESPLGEKFTDSAAVLEQLIRAGVRSGELRCTDPAAAAMNIMYAVEGMKIAARTVGITAQTVQTQIDLILERLING